MDIFNEELREFIGRITPSSSQSQRRIQSPQYSPHQTNNSSSSRANLPPSGKGVDKVDRGGDGLHSEDIPLNVFMSDPELNELIFLAVKVLRIHLQELHKVNELSKDFCSRYITSLKTKFQSDLLRFQDSEPPSPAGSEGMSPFTPGSYPPRLPQGNSEYPGYNLGGILAYSGVNDGGVDSYPHRSQFGDTPNPDSPELPTYSASYMNELKINGSGVGGGGGGGGGGSSTTSFLQNRVVAALNGLDAIGGSRTKRGVLPKRATQVMKQWLFQHLVHPYPTEDEKRQIAGQTNLTLLQVNNWFINARRRILQPMLESTGPYSSFSRSTTKAGEGAMAWGGHKSKNTDQPLVNKKKKAATARPSNNRFWPASLAAAAVLLPNASGLISGSSSCARSAETALAWAKSRTGSTSPGAAVAGASNGDSSPSSTNPHHPRTRKLSESEAEEMRHAGGYGDLGFRRFGSYGYQEGGMAGGRNLCVSTPKTEATDQLNQVAYVGRSSSAANSYQSFLHQAVIQQQQQQQLQHHHHHQQQQLHHHHHHHHHNHNSQTADDIKPPAPPSSDNHFCASLTDYSNWTHFLEDRQSSCDYVAALGPYARPDEGIYFHGQQMQWSFNANNASQSTQSASDTRWAGGGVAYSSAAFATGGAVAIETERPAAM
uniref:Homeobox domain-containing protein n=1 Tax=Mesocestoides corti TaxID=53468 RepID=A0A5K3F431_MESCO